MKHLEQLRKLVEEELAEPFDVAAEKKKPNGNARVHLRAAIVEVKYALKELEQGKEKR